jgi:hypothetical protein
MSPLSPLHSLILLFLCLASLFPLLARQRGTSYGCSSVEGGATHSCKECQALLEARGLRSYRYYASDPDNAGVEKLLPIPPYSFYTSEAALFFTEEAC